MRALRPAPPPYAPGEAFRARTYPTRARRATNAARPAVDSVGTVASAVAVPVNETPEPIVSNAVLDFTYSLHTQSYAFGKGHRIMVQVQSSWFPIIDRNPQTFVPNIFEAKAADFRAATHRIYRSSGHPSHVAIPVLVKPPA